MKNFVKLISTTTLENMLLKEFDWQHDIGMSEFDEWGMSIWWDYRTIEEIKSSRPDKEISFDEIAETFGWEKVELITDEDGNEQILCYNEN